MKQRFEVLDSWRGIAALGVALQHFPHWTGWLGAENRDVWATAVPFFFVLSAFVLSHSLRNRGSNDFQAFAVRRVARLFPLHILTFILMPIIVFVTAILFALGLLVIKGNFEPDFSNMAHYNALSFFEQMIMIQYLGITAGGWNPPNWSLSIEFWGCLLFFGFFRSPASTTKSVVLAATAIIIALFLYSDEGILGRQSRFLFEVPPINALLLAGLMCFAIGCLTYDLHLNTPKGIQNLIPYLEVAVTVTIQTV